MTRLSFEGLRPGLPGCPSDLALDGLAAEAIGAGAAETTRAHIEGCPACQDRMALRRAGFTAFPALDEKRVLVALHAKLGLTAQEQEDRPQRFAKLGAWLRGPGLGWTAAVAAAVALLVILLVRSPGVEDRGADGVRRKGALALHVFRQRGAAAEEMVSGERFRPGDALRFAVDLPRAGHVTILDIDAQGKLSIAWPLPASARPSDPPSAPRPDTFRGAGNRQELPESVILDELLGEESLYLVHCPAPDDHIRCKVAGSEPAPICPPACGLFRFVIRKSP